METTIKEEVKHLRVEGTDVYLHEYGDGKGKLTISNTYGYNYSHYWGAMGESLSEFIKTINSEYFADKLLGYRNDSQQMDVKKTFTQLRKFFREEMDLPFYKHMEFQKDLREKLKDFQSDCEDMNSQDYFVYNFFTSFINRLDYFLIDNRYNQREIEDSFKGICEQWHFIVTKPSDEYIWLMKFHKILKKHL